MLLPLILVIYNEAACYCDGARKTIYVSLLMLILDILIGWSLNMNMLLVAELETI